MIKQNICRLQPFTHSRIRLILLFLLLANTVACTGRKQSAKGSTATSLPTEVSSDVETSGPVVITFAGYEYERQLFEPLMAEFNQQNPDITVQFTALPEYSTQTQDSFANYYRLLATTADTTTTSGFGSGDSAYFRDLAPLMEADPGYNPADFWMAASDACQDSNGNVLGIPANVMLRGIYYDAQAFDQAGLQHPAPSWTWDDFRNDVTTLAEAVTKQANYADVSSLSKTAGEPIRYSYAERYGTILSPRIEAALAGSNGVIDPEVLQPVVQWYLDQVEAKTIRPTPDYATLQGPDDWDILFQSKNRPAMWGGNLGDELPGSNSATPAYQEYGFAPFPAVADNASGHNTTVWVQCLAVSSGSQNPHAAWLWLNFLSHQWLVLDKTTSQAIATVPGRISVAEAEGFWKILPADLQKTVHYILEQDGYASSPNADAAQVVIMALSKTAAGEMDFPAALQAAAAQQSATGSSAGTPIVVATPRPTPSSDAIVINYYFDPWAGDSTVMKLAERYHQSHPDVTIQVSSAYNTEGNQWLNESFDCMTVEPFPYMKDFMPLDSLFDAEDTTFRQDFDPALLNYYRQDGVLYALPVAMQPSVMVYNADLLAKRGIQPPSPDWTFDTFISLITQASSSNEQDKSYGAIFLVGSDFLFNGRGVVWVDETTDPPTPKFDSPEVASALAWADSLIQSGVLLVSSAGDEANTDRINFSVQRGQVAFWRAKMGQLSESGDAGGGDTANEPLNFPVGILPIPQGDASFSLGPTFAHIISSQSKHPQICWDWIKFLSEQPALMEGVPARKSVAASPNWETQVGKENALVYRLAFKQALQDLAHIAQNESSEDYVFNSYFSNLFSYWQWQIEMAMIHGEDYTALLPLTQAKAEVYVACATTIDYTKMDYRQINEAVKSCASQADPDYK
jgi:ABC-type glycerol-3-phosphate transport system substrate-binding protein